MAYIFGLLWYEYYITTFKTTSLETVHRLWRGTCLRGTLCGDDTYLLSMKGAEKQKSCLFSSTSWTSVVPHTRPMRWCKPIGSQENIFVEYDSNKTVKRMTQWHWNKILYANTNAYLSFHKHGNDCRSTLVRQKFSLLLYICFLYFYIFYLIFKEKKLLLSFIYVNCTAEQFYRLSFLVYIFWTIHMLT